MRFAHVDEAEISFVPFAGRLFNNYERRKVTTLRNSTRSG